jgi:succinate dehydrogenase/fumarate reductase flavoprotein subunit
MAKNFRLFGDIIDTDVLVVGGGGAGLRAAIEAGKKSLNVTLISKGQASKSGATLLAGADLTLDGKSLNQLGFPGVPEDNKEKFFNDIVTQSFYLANQKLVEIYVEDAPKVIKELLDWGLKVSHSEERAIDSDGKEISYPLYRIAKEQGIKIINDIMFLDILTSDNKVAGGIGLDIKTGEFLIFRARSIVMATGGWHKAYLYNAGSRELTGDGQAIAFRVGAALGNMEFVTFCSNVFHWPPMWNGNIFTYILHSIVGGELLNTKNEKFLEKYDPEIIRIGTITEWNKSFISIASFQECLNKNGTLHDGTYYCWNDLSKNEYEKKIEEYYPNWKYKGMDFRDLKYKFLNDLPIEVGPSAEYFEGGILIDEKFSSTIAGLFAAGEATMSLFGANRVAAATTEMLVEGAIAGKYAAEYAKDSKQKDINSEQTEKFSNKISRIIDSQGNIKPSHLLKEIQKTAYNNMGPIRTEKGIKEFLEYVNRAKNKDFKEMHIQGTSSKEYNKELIEILEIENILTVLEVSAHAALMRSESRGVHYRSDYPFTDNNNWLKEIIIVKENENLQTTLRPVTITKMVPPKGVYPYFEMMKMMMKAHSATPGAH